MKLFRFFGNYIGFRIIYFSFWVASIAVNFVTNVALAEDRQPAAVQVDEAKEAEIAQKVKKKIYPGGKDEVELKVQPALGKPIRKITPSVEENSEHEAEHD